MIHVVWSSSTTTDHKCGMFAVVVTWTVHQGCQCANQVLDHTRRGWRPRNPYYSPMPSTLPWWHHTWTTFTHLAFLFLYSTPYIILLVSHYVPFCLDIYEHATNDQSEHPCDVCTVVWFHGINLNLGSVMTSIDSLWNCYYTTKFVTSHLRAVLIEQSHANGGIWSFWTYQHQSQYATPRWWIHY